MQTSNLFLAALTLLFLSSLTSCASVLTVWHDKSYVPVVELQHPLVEKSSASPDMLVADDLESSADELYADGYVLLGYSKFTHTLAPAFNNIYAKMYGEKLGASVVLQEEPRSHNGVHAYTVTYWARGRQFPLGAYYNDLPEDVGLFFPDSLREYLGQGNRPILVENVKHDSPAKLAGLRPGELIAGIDGEPLAGAEDFCQRLAQLEGQTTTLHLWSAEGMRTAEVAIGDMAFADPQTPGAEALYHRQPWATQEYQDFAYISHAFQGAVQDSIAAYNQAVEDNRRAAMDAYQNAQLADLQGSSGAGLSEREARVRGIQTEGRGSGRSLAGGAPQWDPSQWEHNGKDWSMGDFAGATSSWYVTHKSMMKDLFPSPYYNGW